MKYKKGFTLVELIISMSIYSVLLVTLAGLCFFVVDQYNANQNEYLEIDEITEIRTILSEIINDGDIITINNDILNIDGKDIVVINYILKNGDVDLIELSYVLFCEASLNDSILTIKLSLRDQKTKYLYFYTY